jgi:hypothetical protein
MKSTLILCVLLIAAVQIHTVYYDAYDESNSEFLILENTGSTQVILDGWRIASPSSQQDATLIGIIQPNNTFLIADKGWNESRDDSSWPQADHQETLTLSNTKGFVQLIDNQETILDTVGWGDTEMYDGKAHPGVEQGYGLVRVNKTNNNADDFIQQNISFFSQESGSTNLHIYINNSAPTIHSYWIDDNSPESQEIDIKPIPQQERNIAVQVQVQDLNGMHNVSVFVNEYELTTNNTGITANFTGEIPITTQTTDLVIQVTDQEFQEEIAVNINLLSVSSLSIPTDISLTSSPGKTSSIQIPITNTGTQVLDVHIRATLPSWSQQAVGTLTYQLAGNTHNLTNEFNTHNINLAPGEQTYMNLSIKAGYVPASEYLGEIIIAGVAS